MEMLRAFGHPVQRMSQHHATMLQDVAFICCERLARPLLSVKYHFGVYVTPPLVSPLVEQLSSGLLSEYKFVLSGLLFHIEKGIGLSD